MLTFAPLVRRLFRFVVWLGMGVLGLLFALVGGTLLYARTAHFQHLLHDQLVALLQSALDAEIEIGEVHASLWRGVDVQNVTMRKDGVAIVALPRVQVTVNLGAQILPLLQTGTVQATKVVLTAPVLRLVQDVQAGWNVQHLVKAPEPGDAAEPSWLTIVVSQLTIDNGQVFSQFADGKELQLTEVRLEGALALPPIGVRLQAKDFRAAVRGADLPAMQWSGAVEYDDTTGVANLTFSSFDARPALSHVQLTGVVEHLASPTVALSATVDKLAAADVGLLSHSSYLQQDLAGSLQVNGPLSALVVKAALQAPGGLVDADVTADLTQSPPAVQGQVALNRFIVQKVLRLPEIHTTGEVTGHVQFQGRELRTLQAELTAFANGVETWGRPVDEVQLSATLADGNVVFWSSLNGRAGYLFARGSASVFAPISYDVTVMARTVNVKNVAGGQETPQTNINADLSIKGRGVQLETMTTQARLAVGRSTVGPTVISTGEFVGTLTNGQLSLEKGMLLANDMTVNLQGRIGGLRKTEKGTLTYQVRAKNLAPWLAFAGLKGKGALDLDGVAEGNLTALRVAGKLSVAQVEIDFNAVRAGTLSYQLAEVGGPRPHGQIAITASGVQAGVPLESVQAKFEVSGLQPVTVQADVRVKETASRVHSVKTHVQYAPGQAAVSIQELSVQLPTGTWRALRQPHLAFHQNTWTLDQFVLARAEQTIRVAGAFTPQGPVTAHVQIDRFSLEELRPLLGDGPEVKGEVHVDVKVQGAVMNPDVTADLATGPLLIAGQTYASLTGRSSYRQQRFTVDMTVQQDASHGLRLHGNLPLVLSRETFGAPTVGSLDGHIVSDGLSLAFLAPLSKDLSDIRGVVDMDVSLQGPIETLAPAGFVRLRQGNVTVKQLAQTFADIEADLQLGPTNLRLVQLVMHGGEGKLVGTGTVGMSGYHIRDLALSLNAQQLRVVNTKEYQADVSGQVSCAGSWQALTVTGDLSVLDVALRPTMALMKSGPAPADPTVVVVRRADESPRGEPPREKVKKEEAASVLTTSRFYQSMRIDVRIAIPANTWVQMSEGAIELQGDLRVQKERAQNVALSGAIETVRGWVALHGRKFQLEKGAVMFAGTTLIDPTLDVVAKYGVSNYTVRVLVNGTASTPTITFASEPRLEQADILSLLVFAKPASSLRAKEKISLQSQAIQTAAGMVVSDLRQAVAEELGLDNLEFDVGSSAGQSKVGIGK